ncbi:MAG: F0F1 ATP synthase subunit epsilon [Parachlamydiales bacterium]
MYKLLILSPEEILFEGEVHNAIFPGSEGSFEVLPNHTPIISQLKNGNITIDNQTQIPIPNGFLEFSNNNCTVLVN